MSPGLDAGALSPMGPDQSPGPLGADRIRAIVFDLDGTLYDDPRLGEAVHAEAYRYIADSLGIEPAAAELLLRQARQRLTMELEATATLSLAIGELGLDLKALHCRFSERIEPARHLDRDERVVALLRGLAQRYRLVLYTNNNRTLSDKIMRVLGIADCFDRVFTIEDTWRPKPDRGTLELLLAGIGLPAEACLFVGDRYDVDLLLPEAMGAQVRQVADLTDLLRLDPELAGSFCATEGGGDDHAD